MSRLTSAGYDLIEMKGTWCDNYCGEQSKTCRDCAIWKAIQKLAHYEDLEEQLEKLYGDRLTLDDVVNNLNRIVQNGEEKLEYARILTNTEAEKWDKWKDLEEQGRLIEVKHGYWKLYGKNHYSKIWECSECKAKWDFHTKYCPNCGTKMNEVKE